MNSWPCVDPGSLRYQLSWQRKQVSGQNGVGEDLYTWVTVLRCKGDVVQLSGRELQSAQQRWAEAQYAVTQNYSRTVLASETWRIAWDEHGTVRYLDVLSVVDRGGRRMVLDVIAKEWIS